MDVERVRPAQDANAVATEQVEALLGRLEEGVVPLLFVFDAGYDPVKLQRGLEGSPCQILVRLDLIWRSYVRRFDLEHTFCFLKQSMGWTTPRVRYPNRPTVGVGWLWAPTHS